MRRTAVLVTCLASALPIADQLQAAGGSDSSGWFRSFVEVQTADGRPSGISYTVLAAPLESAKSRKRILFTSSTGRHLVVESTEKPRNESRWLNCYMLPGGQHLNLAVVAGTLEVFIGEDPVLSLPLVDASKQRNDFEDLRGKLSQSLLLALNEWAQIGRDLEPGFAADAKLILNTVLLDEDPAPGAGPHPQKKLIEQNQLADSDEFQPMPQERAFGALVRPQ